MSLFICINSYIKDMLIIFNQYVYTCYHRAHLCPNKDDLIMDWLSISSNLLYIKSIYDLIYIFIIDMSNSILVFRI